MPSSWDNYGDGPSFQSLLSAFRNANAGTELGYDEFQSLLGSLLRSAAPAPRGAAPNINANGPITYAEEQPPPASWHIAGHGSHDRDPTTTTAHR